jgi:hypothetical protein
LATQHRDENLLLPQFCKASQDPSHSPFQPPLPTGAQKGGGRNQGQRGTVTCPEHLKSQLAFFIANDLISWVLKVFLRRGCLHLHLPVCTGLEVQPKKAQVETGQNYYCLGNLVDPSQPRLVSSKSGPAVLHKGTKKSVYAAH